MKNITLPLLPLPDISDGFSTTDRIVLHLGDAFEFLKTIPSDIAKLIITSHHTMLGRNMRLGQVFKHT